MVLALNKLALVGDEPHARFERALAILRKLDAAGRLAANQRLDPGVGGGGSRRCRNSR
jgi:hypothetical protein